MKKNGFSLIELSIVIAVSAILMTGAMNMGAKMLITAKIKETKMRIETIDDAISAYIYNYQSLPNNGYTDCVTCSDSNYAKICDIPFGELGLTSKYLKDSFGKKLKIVVNLSTTDGILNFNEGKTFKVKEDDSSDLTNNFVYSIFSAQDYLEKSADVTTEEAKKKPIHFNTASGACRLRYYTDNERNILITKTKDQIMNENKKNFDCKISETIVDARIIALNLSNSLKSKVKNETSDKTNTDCIYSNSVKCVPYGWEKQIFYTDTDEKKHHYVVRCEEYGTLNILKI